MKRNERLDELHAHRAVISDVERQVRRDLHDTRYNWIRSQPRRRLLVGLTALCIPVMAISYYVGLPEVTLPALLAYMACLWLLRVAVRGLTDYPDELVDERIKAVRGRVYRLAYLASMGLMSGYLIVYIINQLLSRGGLAQAMSADQLHDLAFAFFFAALALPSAIFAWTEPDEP